MISNETIIVSQTSTSFNSACKDGPGKKNILKYGSGEKINVSYLESLYCIRKGAIIDIDSKKTDRRLRTCEKKK